MREPLGRRSRQDHLQNVYNRVMSVAALERLLSTSQDGDIEVHAYFTQTLPKHHGFDDRRGGSNLIDCRRRRRRRRSWGAGSLGLIVTELVINALKHAFPDGRPGKIVVDYNFHGPNWILCVRDDGVGVRLTPPPGGLVLGTSIVAALAGQLHASTIETTAEPSQAPGFPSSAPEITRL